MPGAAEDVEDDVREDERSRTDGTRRTTPGRSAAERNVTAAEGDTMLAEPPQRPTARQRLRTTLEIIRSNPTGRIALKVTIGIVGAIVVIVGAALIPLPGPGWLLVIGGLGIWAVEFHWARRLLTFTRRNVQGWTGWVTRQPWSVRLLIGAVGLVFVTVVVWLSVKFSLGIDLLARLLAYLATN